jgi:hypothetical protein
LLIAGSCVPFTVVRAGLPAAAPMMAIWAWETGSFGELSYRSTERGTTFLRFSSLRAFSKIDGLKKPYCG